MTPLSERWPRRILIALMTVGANTHLTVSNSPVVSNAGSNGTRCYETKTEIACLLRQFEFGYACGEVEGVALMACIVGFVSRDR